MDEAEIDPYKILELDSTLDDLGDSDVLKVTLCPTLREHACALVETKAVPASVPICRVPVCPTASDDLRYGYKVLLCCIRITSVTACVCICRHTGNCR